MDRILPAILVLFAASAAQAGDAALAPSDPAAYDKHLRDAAAFFETAQPLAAKAPGLVAAIGKADPAKAAAFEKLLSDADAFQKEVLAGKVPEPVLDAKILAAAKKLKADGPKAVAAYRLALAPKGFAPSAPGGAPGAVAHAPIEPVNEAALVSRRSQAQSDATFKNAQQLALGLGPGRAAEDLPGYSPATKAAYEPAGTNRTATASYLPRSNTRSTDLGLTVPSMSIPPASPQAKAPETNPAAPSAQKPGIYRRAVQAYTGTLDKAADWVQDAGTNQMVKAMDTKLPMYQRVFHGAVTAPIALGEGLVRLAGLDKKTWENAATGAAIGAGSVLLVAAAAPAALTAIGVTGSAMVTASSAAGVGGVVAGTMKAGVSYLTIAHGAPAARDFVVDPTLGHGFTAAVNLAPVPGGKLLAEAAAGTKAAEKLFALAGQKGALEGMKAVYVRAAERAVEGTVELGIHAGKGKVAHDAPVLTEMAFGDAPPAGHGAVLPATARPH